MFTETISLKYSELKEAHPKACVKLVEWVTNALEEFQKRIGQAEGTIEIPKITPEIAEKAIGAMLQVDVRGLYDFFDSQGLNVVIIHHLGQNLWAFEIDSETENLTLYTQLPQNNDRMEAETEGFKKAFELLEGRL